MPNFTQAQLEELVDQNGIVGLTLDTTEFFHVGYNYETPSFRALGQFAGTGITAIFSEVVLNEVQADVRDDIEKKTELVRSGLNQVNKAARLGLDVKQLLTDVGIPDASARSKELLDAFINKIEGERVLVDEGVTPRKLNDLYFAAEPPFSKKAEKKCEFPDAMALLSLEHWAGEHGGYVLAVSADGDWKRFGASSEHIICVPQLAAALSLFNRIDAVVAGRLAANLLADTAAQLKQRIDSILESTVESFEIEANAPYYYETEDEHATIESWSVDDYQFDVIDSDDESVTIAFTVNVNATFNAGFTFEVRDPEAGNYWHEIRDTVFATSIIQRSGRHMKLSIGDVLVGLERGRDPEALFLAAFANSEWASVHEERLVDGYPTVFGMVFENMPRELASELHEGLFPHAGYLGAISVHFEFAPHLALYRSSLPPHYRLEGTKLRSFYSMGNQDGCDPSDLEDMRRFGYTDVAFEDTGAGRTILDDFDTPRHFERVGAFRELLNASLPGGEDDAYQLTMMLEDLSPKLFNALGAAAERLANAENEEEVAQVAISGRRYMEQLAKALFPPTDTPRGKRKLDKAAYRNRLWAFAEDHIQGDPARLSTIGKEIDRVVEELNAGLHADQPKERVAQSISDAAVLTATLFALNPDAVRNGYLAYMDSFRAFAHELATQRGTADQ